MDAIVQKVESHEARIASLEVRTAINETNIQELNKKLDKIDSSINKLTWIVIAAVVGAILKSIGLF